MFRKRWVTLLKALPVLAVVGSLVYFERVAPVEVEAHAADLGEVVSEVPGTGTLESAVVAAPGFPVAGRLVSLAVDEGDVVTAGQLLATLDAVGTEQELAMTRASDAVALAAIERAKADLARARATLQRATRDFERTRQLASTGSLPTSELDAAEERFESSRAEVRALEAAQAQAEQARVVAVRAVARGKTRLDDARIVAPFDGVVVRRHHEAGDALAPGAPVYTIASLRKVWVRAWVDETALGALAVGQTARVELRSHPNRAFTGKVERIGRQSDRQTHELLVDVLVEDLPERFALGEKADVFVELERRDGVVRIPRGYCDVAARTCLVERGGRAQVVPVALGVVGRRYMQITSGLSAGERVLRPSNVEQRVDGRRIAVRAPS